MHHSFFYFLRSALVPELGTDVTARAAGDVKLGLIAVAAVGAFPHELAVVLYDLNLAVETALLAVVGLGVELCVHYIVVNELHDAEHGLEVVLHIGHLDVRDRAAGRQLLELAFEREFAERVDGFCYVNMIAVRDIALVRHAGDNAETLLQALGEFIRRGFERRAVQRVVDILCVAPRHAGVVESLHDFKPQLLALFLGKLLADELVHALPQSGIAERNGGISAVQQLVYLLALFESCERAVLPQYGRGVGQRAFQTLVTRLERAVAQLETVVEYLPEFVEIASARRACDVDEVYGHDALVEPAVILGFAVLVHVRREEGAAAHARIALAVAVGVDFQLEHHLFGDVVGHEALCRALCSKLGQIVIRAVLVYVILFEHVDKLGERGRDIRAHLVLDALVALVEHLFDDDGEILLFALAPRLAEIHEYRDEGSLSVGREQRDELILYRLYALLDLFAQALLDDGLLDVVGGRYAHHLRLFIHVARDLLARDLHERHEVRQADGLAAVLIGGDLGYNLRGDVAGGGEGMRLLYHGAAYDRAVLQHILEVDEVAVMHVLREIVGVVEVYESFLVRLHDIGRKEQTLGQILADLARHVVALHRVDRGVLVGILLLDLLVVALYKRQYGFVRRVGAAREIALVAVTDIALRDFVGAELHDARFHEILHFFDADGAVHLRAVLFHGQRERVYPLVGKFGHTRLVGLPDRVRDLCSVEFDLRSVSLDDLHFMNPLCSGQILRSLCYFPTDAAFLADTRYCNCYVCITTIYCGLSCGFLYNNTTRGKNQYLLAKYLKLFLAKYEHKRLTIPERRFYAEKNACAHRKSVAGVTLYVYAFKISL